MMTLGEYVAVCGVVWSRADVRAFCEWIAGRLAAGGSLPATREAWDSAAVRFTILQGQAESTLAAISV
jgi:erythromycin esterase-like protein